MRDLLWRLRAAGEVNEFAVRLSRSRGGGVLFLKSAVQPASAVKLTHHASGSNAGLEINEG
jgi:hypothetical protein